MTGRPRLPQQRPPTSPVARVRVPRSGLRSSSRRTPWTTGPEANLAELAGRVAPMASRSVDLLEVSASLESDGITDGIAHSKYGQENVFDLAAAVRERAARHRVPSIPAAAPAERAASAPDTLRLVGHGALYLIPVVVFPVGVATVGTTGLAAVVALVGGLGWVWAGSVSWLAYRLLGRGSAGGAGRLLAWSAVGVLPLAALVASAVVAFGGADPWVAVLAVGQVAFQSAGTIHMFHRREDILYLSMTPAAASGLGYLVIGEPMLPYALILAALSVTTAFVTALRLTSGSDRAGEPNIRTVLRAEWTGLSWVLLYSALSAAFLLLAQVPFLADRLDVLVAFLPLYAGMGVVEWRVVRFTAAGRELIGTLGHPEEFGRGLRPLLVRDLAVCVAAVAALGGLALALLALAVPLTADVLVVAAACAVLAAAYFAAFLLANQSRYPQLCAGLGAALALGAVIWAFGIAPPAVAFLAAVLLLLTVFALALVGCVGEVRAHR